MRIAVPFRHRFVLSAQRNISKLLSVAYETLNSTATLPSAKSCLASLSWSIVSASNSASTNSESVGGVTISKSPSAVGFDLAGLLAVRRICLAGYRALYRYLVLLALEVQLFSRRSQATHSFTVEIYAFRMQNSEFWQLYATKLLYTGQSVRERKRWKQSPCRSGSR